MPNVKHPRLAPCASPYVLNRKDQNAYTKSKTCLFYLLEWSSVLCWGRNIDWGCLRTGCWWKYLALRGRKWQEGGKNCMRRSFTILYIAACLHIVILIIIIIIIIYYYYYYYKNASLRRARHVAPLGTKINSYKLFVREPQVRQTLGKSRRRWKDNIKRDLQEI